MSTSNSRVPFLALLALAWLAGGAAAQEGLNTEIAFPPESPVSVVSADWGASRATPRGGALLVDIHTSLKLRNSSKRRIRGITLLVLAQEVTPGGKASVSVPSLDVGPGEIFPVRIDLRLLRPLQRGSGPLVKVGLDGVLFDDLSFFGPNRLNSRRLMTVWELQARRERRYLKGILAARGPEGLRREVILSLARQAERPRMKVQVARAARSTNFETAERRRLTFLHLPGAPVQPIAGMARVSGREAQAPEFEMENLSKRAVRHFELGWIIEDVNGHRFVAGSVPADVRLAPGARSKVAPQRVLRFSRPLMVKSMSAYVSQVEFEDGKLWIPSREELAGQGLDRLVPPSPEEQRLTNLYRKKGLKALIAELAKF